MLYARFALRLTAPLLITLAMTSSVVAGTTRADHVAQHGITLTFDREHAVGQFANGDWWVAVSPETGTVRITAMSPDFDGEHNGYMVNPSDPGIQSFDARMECAPFDAALAPELPYDASPGDSIIKAISRGFYDEAEAGDGRSPWRYSRRDLVRLETAAVLTILAEPPDDPGHTFRPPYVGDEKPMHRVDELRLDLLPAVAAPSDVPSLADMRRRLARVQLEHIRSGANQGRSARPMQNMPDYGAEIGRDSGAAAVRLMVDEPIEDRMDLLIAYVQYGIDLYHAMLHGTTWPGNGGQNLGRKLPMVFAAVLLDDEAMQRHIAEAPAGTFHEDESAYYSPVAKLALWGHPGSEPHYYQRLEGGSGSRTIRDPHGYIDGGDDPGGSYQFCCNSKPFKGAALAMVLMPELRDLWDHEPYLDYVDRWVNHGAWTLPDPHDRFPDKHGANADEGHYGSGFVNAMWDAHRGPPALIMPHIEAFRVGGGSMVVELASPHADDVTLRYTLDGSEPTADAPRYGGPIELTGPGGGASRITVRARAFADDRSPSAVTTATFQVDEP